MHLLVFDNKGVRVAGPDRYTGNIGADLLDRVQTQHPGHQVVVVEDAEVPDIPPEAMLLVDGQVVADPAWQPPAPPPDPLAELAAKVDRLPAGTIHETRMRDQKEFMKAFAIPWVKANPQATPVDAALAILAALWAEFPADPICIQVYEKDPVTGREDGLLMSYAESAHAAGLTPDPSWQALRELILQAPEQQLREALRKL